MKNSKYVLLGLSVFCLLLIAVTSFNNGILAPLRTGVGYFLIPIQSGVNVVGESVYNNLKDMATMKDALAENEELKSRVAELMEENNRLQEEQFELARLRELYELDQESNISDIFLPGILIGYATDLTVDSNNMTKSGYILPVAEFDDLKEVLVITRVKETGDVEE